MALNIQNPETIKAWFFRAQYLLVASAVIWIAWRMRSGGSSNWMKQEVDDPSDALPDDLKRLSKEPSGPSAKKDKKPSSQKKPLALGGISINAKAHEILGVAPGATAREIQLAYRARMKQYHPDLLAPAGSRVWKDAMEIAEAINRAKAEMLEAAGEPEKSKRSKKGR